MARLRTVGGRGGDLPDNGDVTFSASASGRTWEIFYTPKPAVIAQSRLEEPTHRPPTGPILLAKGGGPGQWIETYPLNVSRMGHGLFGSKYEILKTIRFENLTMVFGDELEHARWALGSLTDGFIKSPESGLGLKFENISIANELEAADISKLVVRSGSRKGLPKLTGPDTLTMARVQFDELRRGVQRIHTRALARAWDEKHRMVHNAALTKVDDKRFPLRPPQHEPGAIIAAIRAGVETVLPEKDRAAALAAVGPLARDMVTRKPAAVQALAREVEVVTLEELIRRYEKLLGGNRSESVWQTFFTTHPFALKLAFGYPIVAMGDQVSVGGSKFDGKGEKIADFTASAALSGNLAIVEIKKPGTQLLTKYRGEVFAPSHEMAGSITQVLDQKYQLQTNFAVKKVASRAWELEAYAVQCLVVIGRNPETDDEKKSFEMFRRDLRHVVVITFDELLFKLKTILQFLRSVPPEELEEAESDDGVEDAEDGNDPAGDEAPDEQDVE